MDVEKVATKVASNTDHLYSQFVASFVWGREICWEKSPKVTLSKAWKSSALTSLIDTAQRELDAQKNSLDRTVSRAQLLFTTLLALITLVFGTIAPVWSSGWRAPRSRHGSHWWQAPRSSFGPF